MSGPDAVCRRWRELPRNCPPQQRGKYGFRVEGSALRNGRGRAFGTVNGRGRRIIKGGPSNRNERKKCGRKLYDEAEGGWYLMHAAASKESQQHFKGCARVSHCAGASHACMRCRVSVQRARQCSLVGKEARLEGRKRRNARHTTASMHTKTGTSRGPASHHNHTHRSVAESVRSPPPPRKLTFSSEEGGANLMVGSEEGLRREAPGLEPLRFKTKGDVRRRQR